MNYDILYIDSERNLSVMKNALCDFTVDKCFACAALVGKLYFYKRL